MGVNSLQLTNEQYKKISFEIFKLYCDKLPHPLIDEILDRYKNGQSALDIQKKVGQLQVLFKDISPTIADLSRVATHLCNDIITHGCFVDIYKLSSGIIERDKIDKIIDNL